MTEHPPRPDIPSAPKVHRHVRQLRRVLLTLAVLSALGFLALGVSKLVASGFDSFILSALLMPVVATAVVWWFAVFLTRRLARSRRLWLTKMKGATNAFTVRLAKTGGVGGELGPFPASFAQWATAVAFEDELAVYGGEVRPYKQLGTLRRSAIESVTPTRFNAAMGESFGIEIMLRGTAAFVMGVASLEADAPRPGSNSDASTVATWIQAWLANPESDRNS